MELWDAYLEDGTRTGGELVRGEPIPAGLFHLACEVIVRHRDGSFLLMQRDFQKEGHPGLFEAAAGGSALKGEDAVTAAKRELFEETGIRAETLRPIHTVIWPGQIIAGFECVTDWKKDAVVLQAGETVGYRWLTREEFLAFVDTPQFVPTQRKRLEAYIDSIR